MRESEGGGERKRDQYVGASKELLMTSTRSIRVNFMVGSVQNKPAAKSRELFMSVHPVLAALSAGLVIWGELRGK